VAPLLTLHCTRTLLSHSYQLVSRPVSIQPAWRNALKITTRIYNELNAFLKNTLELLRRRCVLFKTMEGQEVRLWNKRPPSAERKSILRLRKVINERETAGKRKKNLNLRSLVVGGQGVLSYTQDLNPSPRRTSEREIPLQDSLMCKLSYLRNISLRSYLIIY
jgi:hypothetical protein